MSPFTRILVFAPNWLGDAVMAVPCVAAIRGHYPAARLGVAARSQLAALYEMVPGVDQTIRLEHAGRFGGWLGALRDSGRLREAAFDLAILLPNSFRTAWMARRAGIPERWGYAADGRATLLTRTVPRAPGCHQVEYYQRLLEALGVPPVGSGLQPGTRLPSVHLDIAPADREWARQTLSRAGWTPGEPLVGMAPGAAYGGAKQWPPARFAQLALELSREAAGPVRTVLVGSAGDRGTCEAIVRGSGLNSAITELNDRNAIAGLRPDPVNLCGKTDLRQLAAVIAECRTFVSNDSGAMHLAAAVGVPVVAIFGSTNEKETAPLPLAPRDGSPESGIRNQESGGASQALGTRDQEPGTRDHAIVATDIDCRPCMLRECPLENHPCMTGIDVGRVKAEVLKRIGL